MAILCHIAWAEDIDAETRALIDITEADQNAQLANYAYICQLRNFDWVSAINSMVLERAARDIEALRQAGDTPNDIRGQWEMIARGMTFNVEISAINCDHVNSSILGLDGLAARGGYSTNP